MTETEKLQAFLSTRILAMAGAIDPNDRLHDMNDHWHLQHADIVRQQLQHLAWLANYLAHTDAPQLIDLGEQLTCEQERQALTALSAVATAEQLTHWQTTFSVWFPPAASEPELF